MTHPEIQALLDWLEKQKITFCGEHQHAESCFDEEDSYPNCEIPAGDLVPLERTTVTQLLVAFSIETALNQNKKYFAPGDSVLYGNRVHSYMYPVCKPGGYHMLNYEGKYNVEAREEEILPLNGEGRGHNDLRP